MRALFELRPRGCAQVNLASLQGMLRDMRLTTSTYVFTEGMSSWTPVKAVEILMSSVNGSV